MDIQNINEVAQEILNLKASVAKQAAQKIHAIDEKAEWDRLYKEKQVEMGEVVHNLLKIMEVEKYQRWIGGGNFKLWKHPTTVCTYLSPNCDLTIYMEAKNCAIDCRHQNVKYYLYADARKHNYGEYTDPIAVVEKFMQKLIECTHPEWLRKNMPEGDN